MIKCSTFSAVLAVLVTTITIQSPAFAGMQSASEDVIEADRMSATTSVLEAKPRPKPKPKPRCKWVNGVLVCSF